MSVLVVLQSIGGDIARVSLEALAAGWQLAEAQDVPLEAAILGYHLAPSLDEFACAGLEKVYLLDHALLAEYTPEAYTLALEQLVESCSPLTVVFPHTYQVRDYAPKLAARFGSALISDVVDIKAEGLPVYYVRQLFLGKFLADVSTDHCPAFVSVQANAFRPLGTSASGETGQGATMERVSLQLDPAQIASRPEPPFRESQNSVDLAGARRIVAVGRGLGQKEDLAMVEELARVLDAEVAGSRPICDNGWLSMERLVGSSGQTVTPDLYFALGISGAIQHTLGMGGAKTIVAVNRDEAAPIFDGAHYGIVGDLNTVIPALVDELRKMKS